MVRGQRVQYADHVLVRQSGSDDAGQGAVAAQAVEPTDQPGATDGRQADRARANHGDDITGPDCPLRTPTSKRMVEDVQVCPADRGRVDPYDRVAAGDGLGTGDVFTCLRAWSVMTSAFMANSTIRRGG